MALNQKAWQLKHQLITQSINKTGNFNIEEINQKVFKSLNIDSYELPEENQPDSRVVVALRKVLKGNENND